MFKYDLQERYIRLNQNIAQKLNWPTPSVRVYRDLLTSLFDTIGSLQNFLPHKAFYAVSKKGTSVSEFLAALWLKNSNTVQFKLDTQNWIEYIESLHAETNFVLWSSENEITGEVVMDQSLSTEIHQKLNKKRIFSIQVTHQSPKPEEILPFSIIVVRPSLFETHHTFVFYGDKFKATLPVSTYQDLTVDDVKDSIDKLKESEKRLRMDRAEQIKNFEALFFEPRSLYFNRFVDTTPRIFDRIILSFSDIQGEYILQKLEQKGYQDCGLAPSAYPFWLLDHWKNWWNEAESEIFLRGLCVLNVDKARDLSEFSLVLKKIIEEARS